VNLAKLLVSRKGLADGATSQKPIAPAPAPNYKLSSDSGSVALPIASPTQSSARMLMTRATKIR